MALKAAYALMAGQSDSWSTTVLQETDAASTVHPITMRTLYGDPNISLIFRRLPDGNGDGSGFPSTGHESLQKLWAGTPLPAITQIHPVDGSTAYTKSALTSVLTALINSSRIPSALKISSAPSAMEITAITMPPPISPKQLKRTTPRRTPLQLISIMDLRITCRMSQAQICQQSRMHS